MKRAKGESSSAKARTKRSNNRTGSRDNTSALIGRRIAQRQWAKARTLIQEELVFTPTDHWLWTTLGLTYYEEQDYAKALKCSEYAVQLAPSCPLVLWDYAGALFMTDQEESALAIWMILRNRDLETLAYGEHCEGMAWALQLVNDVQYRIGRYYQWSGEIPSACMAFQKYLHNRKHGVGSIYDAATVKQYLAQVPEEATSP